MARKINKLPETKRGSRGYKYPFEQWADGSIWELRHGDDYKCSHTGMVSNLNNYGKANGFKVVTRRVDGPRGQVGIAVQFTKKK